VARAVEIFTVASCSNIVGQHRGMVVVSGSYGGNYNAYNAAKRGVRAVIMNDARVGKDRAGVRGLDYLQQVGLAGAVADANTCHIGDGADVLAHGVISFVNEVAARLGCAPGQTAKACAELMKAAPLSDAACPPISEGGRFVVHDKPDGPRVVCIDTAGMIEPGDAGGIVITGSHGALSNGRPDNVVSADLLAIFFSDGGIGKDDAGVQRLADLDSRSMIAGAVSIESAPIGDSRAIYHDGILSRVNQTAARNGGRAGMALRAFVDRLVAATRR
jgi:hypothetical protein